MSVFSSFWAGLGQAVVAGSHFVLNLQNENKPVAAGIEPDQPLVTCSQSSSVSSWALIWGERMGGWQERSMRTFAKQLDVIFFVFLGSRNDPPSEINVTLCPLLSWRECCADIYLSSLSATVCESLLEQCLVARACRGKILSIDLRIEVIGAQMVVWTAQCHNISSQSGSRLTPSSFEPTRSRFYCKTQTYFQTQLVKMQHFLHTCLCLTSLSLWLH